MSNWLLITIGSTIGAILLNVFSNLLTDPTQSLLTKLSNKWRQRSLKSLEKDLQVTTTYHFDANKFNQYIFSSAVSICLKLVMAASAITAGSGALILSVLRKLAQDTSHPESVGIGSIIILSGLVILYITFEQLLKIKATIWNVMRYGEYSTQAEIKKQKLEKRNVIK